MTFRAFLRVMRGRNERGFALEQIGTIARRLVERCRRVMEAEKRERDRLSVVLYADPTSNTDTQPAPDAGESDGHKIAPDMTPRMCERRDHGPTPRYQG